MEKKKIFFLLLAGILFLFLTKKVLAVNFGDVVINEVMWMGSSKSSQDEWIELRNNTSQKIRLNGWRIDNLLRANEVFIFPDEPIIEIEGEGFFLVSYYSKSDQIEDKTILNNNKFFWRCKDHPSCASFSLANSDNGDLILVDSSGNEIDRASGDPWPAGKKEASACYSMERINPLDNGANVDNWATATKSENLISGVLDKATPGSENGSFLSLTFSPTPTPTPIILPSPVLPTATPAIAITVTPTPSPTKMPTPSPGPAKAIYQINEVKNEKGEALSSVKIYVDNQYIHHYAPEVLEFCNSCYCDNDKKVACGFGEHSIRLEKNGYQDWEETKVVRAGDFYPVNPVMKLLLSPTSTPKATPFSSLSPTERLSPSLSLATTSLLLSPTSSSPLWLFADFALAPKKITSEEEEILEENSGQVLGEEKKEKKNSGWYFGVGAFYLGASGWRLARRNDNDIMEKLNFEEK